MGSNDPMTKNYINTMKETILVISLIDGIPNIKKFSSRKDAEKYAESLGNQWFKIIEEIDYKIEKLAHRAKNLTIRTSKYRKTIEHILDSIGNKISQEDENATPVG